MTLRALPAEVTGQLPAEDRERLATFDEQIAELIGAAKERGFSEATAVSILASRERLYAERAVAWKRLVLYGAPLVAVERFGDDEGAARAWVAERLGQAVRDHVADTLRTGRWGRRQERYRPIPHFETWLGDHDLTGEESVVIRAYTDYVGWLDAQGDAVVAEADAFLARDPHQHLQGSVVRAARGAASEFRRVVFKEFDDLFGAHLRRGVEQVGASASMPRPPIDDRGFFRRLVDRFFDEAPTSLEDRKAREYQALSGFFEVANRLSRMLGQLDVAPQVTPIVDGFKREIGLDRIEVAVLDRAKATLDARVNRDTAFAFLAAFDGELPWRPRRPEPDSGPARDGRPRPGAGRGSAPVTVASLGGATSVTFTRAALDDGGWTTALHQKVTGVLASLMPHHTVTQELVTTLCQASLDLRDEDGTRLDKRVLRRLALVFHPDVQPAAGDGTDANVDPDGTNARTLSRLIELHRTGTFGIRAEDAAVTIVADPRA